MRGENYENFHELRGGLLLKLSTAARERERAEFNLWRYEQSGSSDDYVSAVDDTRKSSPKSKCPVAFQC